MGRRGLEEREGEFQQSLGLSYEVNPHFLFGAEFVHEVLPDWSETEPSKVFCGQTSPPQGAWWATLTALGQLLQPETSPTSRSDHLRILILR